MRRLPVRALERRAAGARRGALLLALCLVVTFAVAVCAGCRDSDAMKEIIYDQNASDIDYENPLKHYVNDSAAVRESDAVSSLEVSDEDSQSDEVQNLVVYSSEPNSEGFVAKRSAFSPHPDFPGIEASETVFFYRSDSVDAYDHPVTALPEQPEEAQDEQQPEEAPDQGQARDGSDATSAQAAAGDVGGSAVASTTPDATGASAGGEDQVESADGTDGFTSTEGIGSDKSPTLAFNISDRDAEVPHIDSVAAFGQFAVIVQMVGGTGALAATDAVTKAQFDAEGVANTSAVAFSDASGDPAALNNVKALVASGAKAILVEDPAAYCRQLSAERFEYLEANGVQWISLRSLTSSTNIKADVATVGELLQGSALAAHGAQASRRAADYAGFHDRVVAGANGGLAGDAVNGARPLQRDGDADGLGYSANDATYTVLVSAWDPGAVCSGAGMNFVAGAAYAPAGYATTPVSYYLQAGGSINNAAALSTSLDTGLIPVLQFSQTESWNASLWTNASYGANILYGKGSLLNSGVDQASTTVLGKGLGSDAMPKIIVTSGEVKSAILANSAKDDSLYHAYGYTGSETVFGALGVSRMTAYGETSIWSCIGSDGLSGTVGDANPIFPSGAIDADCIVVNPSGYFCDWTQGTVESFLEAGWAAGAINGVYSLSQWRQDVIDFYEWAYGISADLNRIEGR